MSGGARLSVADRGLIVGAAIGAGAFAITRRRRDRETRATERNNEAQDALSADQRQRVSFALEVIDRLAASYDFDPQDLVSPQTGRPLGPVLERLRTAVGQNRQRCG
jgi:hypothetical protein